MTITSRITGFLRDLVFAHFFGAVSGFDAFLVAYRIPNFLRRLFAEGAFSQAFVPVLSEYRLKSSEQEIQLFLNRMAGLMITVLFAITVIAILITPIIVWIFVPGFIHDTSRYELAATMLRITFPYILFISLTAYVSGILNSYGKFSIPAFTPNLLNFALIGAAIYMAPWFAQPVQALAWGIFIGGIAQLLFQLPFLKKLNLMPKPQFFWKDPGVKKVLKLMVPAILGVSVAQISFFIDTLFASFLPQGSISWLYYSDRLTSFPLGVFGIAIATVILPHLSRKFAAQSQVDFSLAIDWAIKFIVLVALPATISLILLSGPILTTLFHYGKFTAFDVTMTQRSLLGFSFGIPAYMLVKIFASGCYARQDIKTPVRIAIIAIFVNIGLDAILMIPFKHAGLALATSLSSCLNVGLLFWTLRRKNYYQSFFGWKQFLIRILSANIIMAIVLIITMGKLSTWLHWHWVTRMWHLGLICLLAAAVYTATLWLCGIKWREFLLAD